ncbi:MAG: alpha/beta hydrolase [Oxalobacter sp.]|nr:MAG: alpha/beta hydrolase [Oxalobacter sp.]
MYSSFYFPDRVKYDSPERAGLAFEPLFFNSADGTLLSGWFIPAQEVGNPLEAKGTVLHMHGNAHNMTMQWQYVQWVPEHGYNVFVFDYRGYGQSHGTPEPKGVFEDAVAALDYVRSRADIDTDKLFVFGQSLGGMIAIASVGASPQGVRAVLAEAPFHSYTALADDRTPGEGAIVDETWSASTHVAKLAPIPLLLIHGTSDRVVPYSHSEMLLAEAHEPKQLVTVAGGDHLDIMTDRYGTTYQDMMVDFFARALQKT